MNVPEVEVLEILKKELALLCAQLDTYQALFLLEQERRAPLINDAAPGFFALTQLAMVESILMRVSRLMDPECTGRGKAQKHNASFRALIRTGVSVAVDQEWACLLEGWNPGGKFNRVNELRNKFLAHNDLGLWNARENNEAWIPISTAEFDAVIALTKRLWSLFILIHPKSDVIPPAGFGEAPTVILRSLAGAEFLNELLKRLDDVLDDYEKLPAFISARIGSEQTQPCIES